MFRIIPVIFFLAGGLLACSQQEDAQPTSDSSVEIEEPAINVAEVLQQVHSAMGTQDLRSLTYTGNAWRIRNSFRQTLRASPPWPLRDFITGYERTLDLDADSSLATGDTFAQNLFFDPPTAGTYIQNIPASANSWRQQMEYWLTPWGFLDGASSAEVSASSKSMEGQHYTVLSWQSPEDVLSPSGMRYTINAWVNDDHVIAKTETWVEDDFMGDMHVVGVFSDYRLMDGVLVPAMMEIQQGGGGVFGVAIIDAVANPENLDALMEAPAPGGGGFFGGGGEPPAELFQQIDDGVYLVVGGYVALVVEFEEYLAVFEAGQSRQRGQQILDEINANLPGKPVRYIINSHPHSDHTAGLIPFLQSGATLVTHENNVEFMSMALSTPRTLLGEDTLTLSVQGAGDTMVLEDGSNRLELHHVPNGHTDGMLVALLPAQGIMFQADFTLPVPGADANPFVVELAQLVDRKGLEFERYLAVHAAQAPQTKAELMAALEE